MTEVIKDSNENPEKNHQAEHHRIKSFVVRAGRMTEGQVRAIEELGPKYMVDVEDLKPLDLKAIFGREAPLVVEIGFGMGVSFVQMAKDAPECNFLGIEVHPPGVGSALKLIEENQLTNVKVIKFDAFEVLSKCLAPESVDVLQIFSLIHGLRRDISNVVLSMTTLLSWLNRCSSMVVSSEWQLTGRITLSRCWM